MPLPPAPDFAAFDPFHADAAAWRAPMEAIARRYSDAPVVQALDGTVLVARVGRALVIKLYPPFLADHFAYERAAIAALSGQLSVPTPALIDSDQHEGWPYLVMTQLAGTPLRQRWPALDEAARCALLRHIGAIAAEVHALPSAPLAGCSLDWDAFIAAQRAGCRARHERTGLPPQLLADLSRFVAGDVPAGPKVILTGEYTPMNLLADDERLVGMYDFGDGLLGPARYDWLGPLCFLAAGDARRREAFVSGYGGDWDDGVREELMRLLLLHRYANLRVQIARDDWHDAPSLSALAARVFA